MNLTDYLLDVKTQLHCNASDDYKNNYITYNYTNTDIDDNISYFENCFNKNLSAYKALLYFEYEKN